MCNIRVNYIIRGGGEIKLYLLKKVKGKEDYYEIVGPEYFIILFAVMQFMCYV